MKVKYKKVDSSVHGEVKEIKLIGEDEKDNSIWIGILIAFVIALGALLRSNG